MSNKTEQQILTELGVKDFRNLTKDMWVSLYSSLHELDKDVAMKIIDQFPAYKDAVCGYIDDYKDIAINAISVVSDSNKSFFIGANEELSIVKEELNREDLSFDQRMELLDRIHDVVEEMNSKDTENKNFVIKLIGGVGVILLGAVAALGTALGSSLKVNKHKDELD